MRIRDWSADVCSSDLRLAGRQCGQGAVGAAPRQRHVGALAAQRVAGQRTQRRRHAVLAAGAVEDQGVGQAVVLEHVADRRSEEHKSELQSLMRISYAVFCLKKKKQYRNKDKLKNI